MSCEPADRRLAEEGIRHSHAAAGLAPPDRIVWCGGPMEIAKRLATASPDDPIGVNVKAQVFDNVRDKVGTLAEIFWKEVVVAAVELSHHGTVRTALSEHNRCKEVSTAVNRAVVRVVDSYLCRFSVRAGRLALRWRGLPHLLPRSTFEDVAVGLQQLASLGVYEYLHDVLPWDELTRPMKASGLDDAALARYVSEKFAAFARQGKRIAILDDDAHGQRPKRHRWIVHPAVTRWEAARPPFAGVQH